MNINTSITLPNGLTLKNRIVKAAMTERLSNSDYGPNEKHLQLYRTWSEGGAGLMITGNVMVDHRYMESAGNVAIEDERHLEVLKQWAAIGQEKGQHIWPQLNHSGRQTSILVNRKPVSASDVHLKKLGLFAKPRPMSLQEVEELVKRFGTTAKVCQKAGFTGVQIHAAHGYLLSQFLSPLTNQRTDRYGGTLENRARLLLEVIREVRQACGPAFGISVKINSADFQRGGFTEEESLQVIQMLNQEGVDLLEVSGGTYERVAFFEEGLRTSTLQREAFFLEFAKKAKAIASMPLMLTGGFRTLAFANKVLSEGEVDVIGVARPYLLYENFPKKWLQGKEEEAQTENTKVAFSALQDNAIAGYYNKQIELLSKGKPLNLRYSPLRAAFHLIKHELVKGMRKK
ncbi:NADH:flavin oxidoreductase/NADH oxidase family protein [Algivirga pacifica]|uniref:NADH:flavin oxidoreductase/NADH oxidase family protein n=1 Tax=Algivirga pacifica TaxID=1162670 RepID=A0ABP9D3R3_9BACT